MSTYQYSFYTGIITYVNVKADSEEEAGALVDSVIEGVTFTVGGEGTDCNVVAVDEYDNVNLIATDDVWFIDSPKYREAIKPKNPSAIKPIVYGQNLTIGQRLQQKVDANVSIYLISGAVLSGRVCVTDCKDILVLQEYAAEKVYVDINQIAAFKIK